MSGSPRCQRCGREATHAVAVEGVVLLLCTGHHREVAERLRRDPLVTIGRRQVCLAAPLTEGARR